MRTEGEVDFGLLALITLLAMASTSAVCAILYAFFRPGLCQ